ncbi:holin [Streptomyces litchfieldiae]|uniref:Holin n=1 Tax=Streptomyces litchfieldiae TaxID=3075543 RepID=A0ABU2MWM0_9ACTN|nr:holin [Streptomyces sp. DSM 44938]MDT0345910.1 holin [Streptomyces sp. DSM 44938]
MTSPLPSPSGVLRTARTYLMDLAERVVATFVVSAAGVAIAAGPAGLFSASMWETAGAAGLAAAGSLLKGVLAKAVGDRNSASAAPGV